MAAKRYRQRRGREGKGDAHGLDKLIPRQADGLKVHNARNDERARQAGEHAVDRTKQRAGPAFFRWAYCQADACKTSHRIRHQQETQQARR